MFFIIESNVFSALAFCDWSDTQRVRRELLKAHTFPRAFTEKFSTLDNTICDEMASIVSQIQPGVSTDLKLIILLHSANIFFKHFCSRSFEVSNPKLLELVENFDEIFYEVNQGHAADFLPFLMHFHKRKMKKMNYLTHKIRDFIENEIIEDRFENYNPDFEPEDYVDTLIHYVRSENTPILTWDAALFSLEDIIGGHSAVANFLTKVFAFLVTEGEVQKKIQQEIDSVVGCDRLVNINDRNSMPFTQAVIYEAIRLIASPIVPRVANQNSSIGGYRIEKGSVLFLNNYDLSMSDELWEEPNKFLPKRFIKNGKLVKPDHFLPFGGGRRSCMGYRMVHLLSFGIIGGLLQHFSIIPVEGECYEVPIGSLALKKDTFKFQFVRR
nr:cytochrome P450 307a1-like [Leptinotarsa decemlineata]